MRTLLSTCTICGAGILLIIIVALILREASDYENRGGGFIVTTDRGRRDIGGKAPI